MSLEIRCEFCGEEVNPNAGTTWRRIAGWERHAGKAGTRAGGGSDIVLREPTGELACPTCIARLKSGVAVEQESLL